MGLRALEQELRAGPGDLAFQNLLSMAEGDHTTPHESGSGLPVLAGGTGCDQVIGLPMAPVNPPETPSLLWVHQRANGAAVLPYSEGRVGAGKDAEKEKVRQIEAEKERQREKLR